MQRAYFAGCAAAALLMLGLGAALAGPDRRPAVLVGVLVALAVQVPLGWLVIRALGGPLFLAAWGMGLLLRLVVLGAMAFGVGPALGLPPAPLLLSLAGALFVLLLVEGTVTLGRLPGIVKE